MNFLNIRNQSLPQFFRRQVLVLSAHQIVIGKELDIGLSNLQSLFLHISAGEDIGVWQHIVVYQLAHNLVRKWAAVATDDAEADLAIFEKLMAFDDEGLARRALAANRVLHHRALTDDHDGVVGRDGLIIGGRGGRAGLWLRSCLGEGGLKRRQGERRAGDASQV